jgi:hypothetical protein
VEKIWAPKLFPALSSVRTCRRKWISLPTQTGLPERFFSNPWKRPLSPGGQMFSPRAFILLYIVVS